MGPVVNRKQLEKIERYIGIGVAEGASLAAGGKRLDDGAFARGSFFAPTVFDRVGAEMRIAQEEIFGPVVSVIEVRDLDEAIAVNNRTPFGLSSALFLRRDAAFTRCDLDLGTSTSITHHRGGAHLPLAARAAPAADIVRPGTPCSTRSRRKSSHRLQRQVQRAQIDNRREPHGRAQRATARIACFRAHHP